MQLAFCGGSTSLSRTGPCRWAALRKRVSSPLLDFNFKYTEGESLRTSQKPWQALLLKLQQGAVVHEQFYDVRAVGSIEQHVASFDSASLVICAVAKFGEHCSWATVSMGAAVLRSARLPLLKHNAACTSILLRSLLICPAPSVSARHSCVELPGTDQQT